MDVLNTADAVDVDVPDAAAANCDDDDDAAADVVAARRRRSAWSKRSCRGERPYWFGRPPRLEDVTDTDTLLSLSFSSSSTATSIMVVKVKVGKSGQRRQPPQQYHVHRLLSLPYHTNYGHGP